MTTDDSYSMTTTVEGSFEAILARVTDVLAAHGFGVLTEIDVTATLKARLDHDFGRQYKILGACNPPFAHRALEADLAIGLLLPCNVIVYDGEQEGVVTVAAINPMAMMSFSDHPDLDSIAREVQDRLKAALAGL